MTSADVDAIALSAARHNAARGLTGFLLCGGGRFYGVLEGTRRRVFARIERIITDPRHSQLVIVSEDEVTARRFAGWSCSQLGRDVSSRDSQGLLDAFILSIADRR